MKIIRTVLCCQYQYNRLFGKTRFKVTAVFDTIMLNSVWTRKRRWIGHVLRHVNYFLTSWREQ